MMTLVEFIEAIMTPSPTVFILGALIVLVVPFIVHFILVHKTPYTVLPSILLAGPRDGGKTALMTLLERGGGTGRIPKCPEVRTTVTTSLVELSVSNSGENTSSDAVNDEHDLHHKDSTHRRFLLLDTPGHAKLRHHALEFIASSTSSKISTSSKVKGVVFVVDSAALGDDIGTGSSVLSVTAEYLYEILLALQKRMGNKNTSKAPTAVPVLIASNKMDLFTALPPAQVKNSLEMELTRIRVSKSKGLLDSGVGIDEVGSEDQDLWLGSYGTEKFTFEQMREFDVDVEVIGGNVLGQGPGIEKWWTWIISQI